MPLFLLPVVVVVALAALATGVPARKVATGALAATVGLVVLSIVFGVVLIGLDVGEDSSSDAALERPADRPVDAVLTPGDEEGFLAPVVPLDGVDAGDVVLVEAELGESGRIHLCAGGARSTRRCGPGLPVDQPADGVARFLVELQPSADTDCADVPCALVLFSEEGGVLGRLPVVFGRAEPAPVLSIGGGAPFADGDLILVRLQGFAPGAELVVTQCTPPGPATPAACGAPAPERRIVVGAAGTASVELPAHIGEVGSRGGECRRGRPCAVGVVGSSQATPVAELSLAGTAGPVVADDRRVVGLAAFFVFLAAAVLLLARWDWRPVDGDPFADIALVVPPGWEHLGDVGDAADLEGW